MKLFSTQYHWKGIDSQGLRIEGISQNTSNETVLSELRKKDITPLKINKKYLLFSKKQTIKNQDIIDFSRQLTTLLDAGISVTPALKIMAQSSEHAAMKNLISNLKNSIEAGHSLHESLAKYPRYFNTFYCNLIYMGEYSGTLASMLQQVTVYQEKLQQLSHKIKKALLYPIVVVITAVLITAIMLIFVVPQFKTMFQEFGAALPIYTQIVIALSEKAKFILLSLISCMSVLFFAIKILSKKEKYALKIDRLFLQAPLLGSIITKNILARFARTLAITFNAGVPLAEALKISASSCNNLIYHDAILAIYQQVTAGQSIANAMQNFSLFPARMTQMIAIAEESSVMPVMLNKVAEYYEQQVDLAVESLIKLLEPALMIIMGIIVGGLIVAMYLPIFRLGNAI